MRNNLSLHNGALYIMFSTGLRNIGRQCIKSKSSFNRLEYIESSSYTYRPTCLSHLRFQNTNHTTHHSIRPKTYQRFDRFNNKPRDFRSLLSHPRAKYVLGIGVVGSGIIYVSNLERVPISNRLRFNIISGVEEMEISKSQHESILNEYQGRILPQYSKETQHVKRVLERLIPASGLETLNWEIYVIKDDSNINAFVIPGGKVFVFSGLLNITGNEDATAAVLSHEIAHCLARHFAERMSQQFLVVFGTFFISFMFGLGDTSISRTAAEFAFLRPASRTQEAEADYIGLMMLASACFDPSEAVRFWERMEKAAKFEPPAFLSTHPSNKSRIRLIQEHMPEAMDKRSRSDCVGTMEYAQEFNDAFEQIKW